MSSSWGELAVVLLQRGEVDVDLTPEIALLLQHAAPLRLKLAHFLRMRSGSVVSDATGRVLAAQL